MFSIPIHVIHPPVVYPPVVYSSGFPGISQEEERLGKQSSDAHLNVKTDPDQPWDYATKNLPNNKEVEEIVAKILEEHQRLRPIGQRPRHIGNPTYSQYIHSNPNLDKPWDYATKIKNLPNDKEVEEIVAKTVAENLRPVGKSTDSQ